jgi:hypothetical protein
MHLLSFGQVVAFAAFLVLAYGFFLLSDQLRSRNAKFAAIAFGYCAVGSFAQIMVVVSHFNSIGSGLDGITNSHLFYWLAGGLRPYAMLLAAVLTVRMARTDFGTVAST